MTYFGGSMLTDDVESLKPDVWKPSFGYIEVFGVLQFGKTKNRIKTNKSTDKIIYAIHNLILEYNSSVELWNKYYNYISDKATI